MEYGKIGEDLKCVNVVIHLLMFTGGKELMLTYHPMGVEEPQVVKPAVAK